MEAPGRGHFSTFGNTPPFSEFPNRTAATPGPRTDEYGRNGIEFAPNKVAPRMVISAGALVTLKGGDRTLLQVTHLTAGFSSTLPAPIEAVWTFIGADGVATFGSSPLEDLELQVPANQVVAFRDAQADADQAVAAMTIAETSAALALIADEEQANAKAIADALEAQA
jgi:hypothetical protein